MVKRHTIAILATESGSAEINRRAAGAGGRGGEQGATCRARPRIASRQNAHENQQGALRTLTVAGRTQGDSDATGRVVSQSGHLSG